MGELTTITEYFVICHGRSQTHVDAIGETVRESLQEQSLRAYHREGGRGSRWTILDYGSAVAHIFTEESRDFYDLERLWEDAAVIDHLADKEGGEADSLPTEQ